jgi:4-amino-4-deoxy-L-arabinose transferase-like glycosyltransferase
VGLLLGSAPACAWYGLALLQQGQSFLTTGIFKLSLGHFRIVDLQGRSLWFYLWEIWKFSTPWLLFWPYGLRLAWENRNWSWAKFVLVWTGVYVLAISLMLTKLQWYVLPIYPAFALAGGAQLAEVWNLPTRQSYPRVWSVGLIILALGGLAGSLYFAILETPERSLAVIFASMALTMAMAAVLLVRRDLQFILILFWGTYLSMLLLMSSPYWLGGIKDVDPVKPIAAILNRGTPSGQLIYASLDKSEPLLNFYSDRKLVPASDGALKQHWQQHQHPYLLLNTRTFKQLSLKPYRRVGTAPGWVLVTK